MAWLANEKARRARDFCDGGAGYRMHTVASLFGKSAVQCAV